MNRKKHIFFIFLAVLIFGSGCSRRAVFNKYYLIEIPLNPDLAAQKSSPLTNTACEILPVTISPAFGTERIAVRLHTHELTYYAHHQWAVKPEEALFQVIENHLQNTRLFSSVSGRYWKLIPDYQLLTRIYQLEVVQDDEKLSAHLRIDFSLIENASREVAVFHFSDKYQVLDENSMNLFAATISDLFYQEVRLFSEKTKDYFQSSGLVTPGEE
jgi:ABC-type uncharacterized transport system auxiliary subunit